jgi:hypothetical protein
MPRKSPHRPRPRSYRDLAAKVAELLEEEPWLSWDQAVARLI